jgi:hypothetical protein
MSFVLSVDASFYLVDHIRKRAFLTMAHLQLADPFDFVHRVCRTNGNVGTGKHFRIVVEIPNAPKLGMGIERFQIG